MKPAILIVGLALMLGACTVRPVYNVESRPIPASAQTLPLETIERAIIEAGAQRGWRFTKAAPGHLLATYAKNEWSATANVIFDQRTYKITYKESTNLGADGVNIHQNYNRWVNNLDVDIEARLSMLGVTKS